jgi:hypothetical protein
MTLRPRWAAVAVLATLSATALWVGSHQPVSAQTRTSQCSVARAAGSPTTAQDIATRVCFLRGQGFDLGAKLTEIVPTPNRTGAHQQFEHVSIYWSPATGVGWVFGAIRDKWRDTGWENGVLGFPKTGENGTPDGRARYTHFEFGSIYWTPQIGAHEVHGDIHARWAAYGWERAGGPSDYYNVPWALGYPTSDELVAPDGRGRANFFENGAIYWSPDSGAHRVYGRIFDKWQQDGWEGRMGYPIDEPLRGGPGNGTGWCSGGGLTQTFVRTDGSGGTYCEQPGFVQYRPRGIGPMPSGGLPSAIRMGGGSAATTGPVLPAPEMTMPSAGGAWICAKARGYDVVNGVQGGPIPAGLVATQYDTAGCPEFGGGGSMYVTRPHHDMWVCAWAQGAIDGYVVDRTEPGSPLCAGGVRAHITKV